MHNTYIPPWWLNNGVLMTVYVALKMSKIWSETLKESEPIYKEQIFTGAQQTPIFGKIAIPENPKGTIIGTYGITGDLDNQWFLQILGRKAYARDYAVVVFDWRAHGKTAQLSSTLTSDGLNEGQDFVAIAAQAKSLGCPAPFWFTGYSLGGQLALWGVHYAQEQLLDPDVETEDFSSLQSSEIGGGAVICPNLDSNRSLAYLEAHPIGKYIEKAIASELKKLAVKLHEYHPHDIDLAAVNRANTIRDFDRELVISKLGFASVTEYYQACNLFNILPEINRPTLILYAADDPLFEQSVIPDLEAACRRNSNLELILTEHGGHVGYISSETCRQQHGDQDCWWAWNRILDWCDQEV